MELTPNEPCRFPPVAHNVPLVFIAKVLYPPLTNDCQLEPDAIEIGMVKVIVDDLDGEGFILERDSLSDADNYEWQKAAGEDAAVTNIDESQFGHFKISRKKTFVDDNVKKGVRYFYRFRGFNPAGNGPWSEPVSRVQ